MDFALSEEQAQIVGMVETFAAERLAPHALDWDRDGHFPVEEMRDLAALGLGAIFAAPDHGGSGLGRMEGALIFEGLAKGCVTTSAFMSIHNMIAWMVDRFGSETQKAALLPRLATMEIIGAYCLTEPGSGSDAAALRTRAEKVGNAAYRLNGSKAFISGAGRADLYAVMCRTGEAGPKGISCILVPGDAKGLSFGAPERKMGWNAQPTAVVTFEDVEVPAENLLGREGDGFRYAMAGLDGGRVNIAACSLGGASWALDAALAHTAERKAFGAALAELQAVQFKLADMATHLEASRLMVRRAAAALDGGEPDAGMRAAMAKRFATDACWEVVDEALQLHGGYGYIKEYGVELRLRDLRVHRILEGANEIMKLIIARKLLSA